MPTPRSPFGTIGSYTSGGAVGGITPGAPYSGGTPFGQKYPVPDPLEIARRTAQGNLANLADYEAYANKIDAAQYIKMMNQIRQGNPDYDKQVLLNAGMISDELAGKIPQDVVDQLTQLGAERGVQIGSPGSPNTNAALMKAFYDTSTRQQELGAKNYLNFQASIPRTTLTDPSKFGADPNSVYTAQLLANAINASPDPEQRYYQELAAAQSGIKAGRAASGGGGGIQPGAYTPPTLTPYRPAPPPGPTMLSGGFREDPWVPTNQDYANFNTGFNKTPPTTAPSGDWTQEDEDFFNSLESGYFGEEGDPFEVPQGNVGQWGNPYWNPFEDADVGAF
jgi:hypothetical protein